MLLYGQLIIERASLFDSDLKNCILNKSYILEVYKLVVLVESMGHTP